MVYITIVNYYYSKYYYSKLKYEFELVKLLESNFGINCNLTSTEFVEIWPLIATNKRSLNFEIDV